MKHQLHVALWIRNNLSFYVLDEKKVKKLFNMPTKNWKKQ